MSATIEGLKYYNREHIFLLLESRVRFYIQDDILAACFKLSEFLSDGKRGTKHSRKNKVKP